MSARCHRFLDITSTFRGVNASLLKDTTRRGYVSNPDLSFWSLRLYPKATALPRIHVNLWHESSLYTGKRRYVKLAYLENPTCVEVIVHSRTFPLYFIVFRPCLCRTRLLRKLGCIKVIFHSREKFSISCTTGCVEVKM